MVQLITANPPQVSYEESNKTSLSIRPDGQSATRYVQVAGVDVNNMIRSILGYSKMYSILGGPNATAFERYPPEPHPLRPNLYARSVEFVRETGPPSPNGPFGSLQYEDVELSVEYGAMPGVALKRDAERPAGVATHDESWRYISTRVEYGLHNRIIPNGSLAFCGEFSPISTDAVVPEPGVMLEPEATIFLTWLQVPAVIASDGTPRLPGNLEANISSVQGRINSVAFRGYPPLTLYAMAPKRELKDQPDGTPCWEILYTLLQRGTVDNSGEDRATPTLNPDWTRILNSKGTYSRVYRKNQANPARSIYDTVDFKLLFTAN